jgi:chitodextrinase
VSQVVLKLPPTWGSRVQTLSVLGSSDGSSFSTITGSSGYTFDPGTANTVTITVPTTTARHLRLNVTANTGWPAAQVSAFEVYGAATGGDTTPPTAPGNLTATAHTANWVSLSWSASTDNVGVTGYQVRQNGVTVATVSGTSATIGGLTPSTTYSFAVAAFDAAGNVSAPSGTVSATTDPAANTNLAQGRPASAGSFTQTYGPSNAVDGDANTYWESANNAFPQWLQVDLGATTTFSRIVLKLPPSSAWGARVQTLSVTGSTDGSTFSTIAGSAGQTFDPATGNTATITVPAAAGRYVRLTFTGNTGWPAGQVSEYQIFAT